jgi:hypothetical protein
MKSILFLSIAFIFQFSFGEIDRKGNGGDPIAFEFMNSARAAFLSIDRNSDLYSHVDISALTRLLQSTKIVVTNEPIFVIVDGVRQQSVAANFHDPNRIVLHRSAWLAIKDPDTKKALALHEYLSLLGIESSGNYEVSRNITANCYGPQLARDAVRAIALVSNRANISDIVGGCSQEDICQIFANYRSLNYADLYQVKYDQSQCRVTELKLVQSGAEVQNPHE